MFKKITAAGIALAIATGTVFAASHAAGPYDAAITARKAHMQLYAHNLGILGAMAKGAMDYDAELAGVAATNLATLSSMNQMTYWPEGSDSFDNDNTRALPEIWDNFPDVAKKGQALAEAAAAMQTAAGNGLDALRAAIGPVGQACSACHKAYRKPQE